MPQSLYNKDDHWPVYAYALIAPSSSYTLHAGKVTYKIVKNRLFKNIYFLVYIEPVEEQINVKKNFLNFAKVSFSPYNASSSNVTIRSYKNSYRKI